MATKSSKQDDESDDAAQEGEGAPRPGLVKRLLGSKLVLGGLALALLGGGGGAWWFLTKTGEPAAQEAAQPPSAAAFVEMKDMLINISGAQPGERAPLIKFKVALEVSDPKKVAEIQPLLPRVEDILQVYMRELRPSDLEGSAGTFRLKEELLRRVNLAVYPSRVDAILFKELLVQ